MIACRPALTCTVHCGSPTSPAAPSLPQQEVTGSEAFRRGKQAGAKRAEEAGAAGAKIAFEAGK